jgi:hypothetical protein
LQNRGIAQSNRKKGKERQGFLLCVSLQSGAAGALPYAEKSAHEHPRTAQHSGLRIPAPLGNLVLVDAIPGEIFTAFHIAHPDGSRIVSIENGLTPAVENTQWYLQKARYVTERGPKGQPQAKSRTPRQLLIACA